MLKLLDAALFNLTIGNADAHGKNYSLLYKPSGAELAPLYDLMCTAIYPHITTGLAMKFGEARNLDEVHVMTWQKFAEEAGFSGAFVRRRATQLARTIADAAPAVAEKISAAGFDRSALQRLAGLIVERTAQVVASVRDVTEQAQPARDTERRLKS